MPAIWPVAMHDNSRMPELQPDLETETVHAVEHMTMHADEVTLFGVSASWEVASATQSQLRCGNDSHTGDRVAADRRLGAQLF